MKELMVHVERAVRAVHATNKRKQKMRQELLAHLAGIFEEERARLGDDQLALAEALRRFGSPEDLARELQASVPLLERLERWPVDYLLVRRAGESEICHALRLAAMFAVVMFATPLLFHLVQAAVGGTHVPLVSAFLALGTGYGFLGVLAGYGVCREFTGRVRTWSLVRAAGYCLASILLAVALVAGGYVVQPDNPLWWFILNYPNDPGALGTFLLFAAMPPAAGMFMAMVIRVERRRQQDCQEWASLEIGR